MSTPTARLHLDYALGTDAVSSYPATDAQAKAILDNAVIVTEGTLSSRPSGSYVGQTYYATDVNSGTWYFYTGSVWETVIVAGAWAVLTTNVGAGVISVSGRTALVRVVGDTAQLSGALTTNVGLSGGVTLATLPGSATPSQTASVVVAVDTPSLIVGKVNLTTGGSLVLGEIFNSGYIVNLDGIFYPLTP